MTVFWIAALVMIAVSLALVVPPLAGARRARGPARADVRRAVYREQRRDLEAQRDGGILDEDSYRQALEELDRQFLDDGDIDVGEDPPPAQAHPYKAAIVAVLIPLFAAGAYLATGTPQVLLDQRVLQARPAAAAAARAPAAAGNPSMPSVEEMVTSLEERMKREPGDAEGWIMLARSYQVMDRLDDAGTALRSALEHHPRNPVLLVQLAEVTATRNGNRLDGEPIELVERALALEPDYPRALWLAGIHAMNQGDPTGALTRWERVLEVAQLEPNARQQIEQAIAEARSRAGVAPATSEPAATSTAPSLTVTVTLADALVQQVDGSETLFVFARASEGPPMPLAVKRLTTAALPLTVVLDDSDAMAPELRLSRFDPVTVTARVSRGGTPSAQRGDLQGVSVAVSPAAGAPVTVVIDRVVE